MKPLGRKLRERLLNGTWREKEEPVENSVKHEASEDGVTWVQIHSPANAYPYPWHRVDGVVVKQPSAPPCVGRWYSPASGTPFVLLRQKDPGTWVARDGGTDGLFVVMESFLSQCTLGPVTPSASAAIKATHVSIGKDGEMRVAFHREDPRPDEKTKPLLTDYARTETVMLAPGQWFDAGEGSTPFVLVGRPESGVWQARFHGHAKTFDVDESSLMQCRPLPPPPLQAPNPDEWEEDPNQPKFAAGLTGRLPAGEHVVLIAEEGHRGGAGLFAMRVPPGRWVDGKVSCSCEATDHGPSWFGWNTKNKLMRRRQAKPDTEVVMRGRQHGKVAALKAELDGLLAKEAPVGELLPGDVITIGDGSRWKLDTIKRHDFGEGVEHWNAEPLSQERRFAKSVVFARKDVSARVPGWRAGQRRRIRLQSGGEHAGFFEGIVQPRIEEQPAGLWLLRRENSAAWGAESEWSELLAEALKPLEAAEAVATKKMAAYYDGLAARQPLREVSSNGRDWVTYGTVGTDAWPFGSFRRRRVDGVDVGYVDPAPALCVHPFRDKGGELTGAACAKEGTPRMTDIGLLTMCDEHFLSREADVAAVMRNHPTTHAARARMAKMDRLATAPPPPEPSCQPTLFGGIWRPW